MWWWKFHNTGPSFTWMGTSHIVVLIVLMILCAATVLWRKWLKARHPYIAAGIISTFIVGELSLQLFYIMNGAWDAKYALPLNLSSFVWITAILALISSSRIWFEITFFAGVGSAVFTIITPDLASYGFFHYRFFHFFITHGLVILAVCYMLVVEKRTLLWSSVFRAWGVLNLYAGAVFLMNLATGGNYMYLMEKPLQPTPFDWLGPWPYYIFSLEPAALALFILMYGLYKFAVNIKKTGISGLFRRK